MLGNYGEDSLDMKAHKLSAFTAQDA